MESFSIILLKQGNFAITSTIADLGTNSFTLPASISTVKDGQTGVAFN
ncbi:MAG: hypothetical protein IPI88_15395 [Chitinophagaceae bacterium]|nr:hypothetical protein [Chitinophagaceae bacterium]